MAQLPVKNCINLLQIEHPDFDNNSNMLNNPGSDLQRMDTTDLFSGKQPYFLLQQYAVANLHSTTKPLTLSQLRQQNKTLQQKLSQSSQFFDIPDHRDNLLDQPQTTEKVSQSPPINIPPSQPAMYRPSAPPPQQPQMSQAPPPQQYQQQQYQQQQPQRVYTNQPLAPVNYSQNVYVNQRPAMGPRFGVGLGRGMRGGFRRGGFGFRGGRYY